jgi:hypothetical protein
VELGVSASGGCKPRMSFFLCSCCPSWAWCSGEKCRLRCKRVFALLQACSSEPATQLALLAALELSPVVWLLAVACNTVAVGVGYTRMVQCAVWQAACAPARGATMRVQGCMIWAVKQRNKGAHSRVVCRVACRDEHSHGRPCCDVSCLANLCWPCHQTCLACWLVAEEGLADGIDVFATSHRTAGSLLACEGTTVACPLG